jgi:serine/threonine-protein kinase
MNGPALLGGRYEVRDVLGFGGMAEVRDGWDRRLDRAVAIKLLHPGLSSQAEIRQRFQTEACAAAALNHPNIVNVYDLGEEDGTPYIVMERLPGRTLGDEIACGPLPQSHAYTALQNVLAALTAAHGAGMLHRDIKPGNILLAESGGVKVADFGIVKAPGSVRTTTGQLVGTLAYLSADRVAGNPASVSDDLYAVGVVGYEALTGRRPFTEEDIAPLARAIMEDDPPPVAQLRPDVDPQLAEVIGRAMSRDPLRRFPSAEAMWHALDGVRVHDAVPWPVPIEFRGQRSPTLIIAQREPWPVATTGPTAPARHRPVPVRRVAGSAALLGAMAIAAVAFALDPSSATRPTAPEPVSVSTPVPVPVSVEAPVPTPVSVAAEPSPVVQSPASSPIIEQATQQEPAGGGNGKGNGNGNGRGNGHGNKKPK